jgi:hypothetical protein
MPTPKKKTSSANVKVKDLKAKKNPKGGAASLDAAGKIRFADGSVRNLDAASKIRGLQ